MSFSLNTNIGALQAQNNLRIDSDFQATTVSRVTSGFRVVQSGDDPSGLALANSYRVERAVLTQGVRNANEGLSELQIADGGMNDISQMLDRARTLATESASSAFVGDRTAMNSEFQSLMTEIDRQAQQIGLNQGGALAKSISVYIGGGVGQTVSDFMSNGAVSLDLSHFTVDTKGLGLAAYQALGNPNPASPTNLKAGSPTSVANILANSTNTGSEAVNGHVAFTFTVPGYPDPTTGDQTLSIDVNVSGVTDTNSLVSAINTAIQNAASGSTPQAQAFKNANLTANTMTDSLGNEQLAFRSSVAAFQVQGADNVANAFLGNFSDTLTATGQTAPNPLTGTMAFADISTQSSALAAGTIVSNAVSVLGKAQTAVGCSENQFSNAIDLAQSKLTILPTAEASIRDADVAAEIANLTKAQILMQAGMAALAQANTSSQQVLTLLRS